MKKNIQLIIAGLCTLASLSSCGFVGGQLADKAREEQLLKPGALDVPVTGYYDTYSFKFLDKYRVTHDWPVISNCQYRKQPTLNRADRYKGEVYAVRDIYEEGGKTWQRFPAAFGPSYDFDYFVRPTYKTERAEYDAAGKKTGRMLERDQKGLKPVCFEAWAGTSHALTLMLYRRTANEWQSALGQWNQGSYIGPDSKQSTEEVSGNRWQVYRVAPKPPMVNRIAGPFELWILPIKQTNYTLALELAANQNSLQSPKAHANFQAMFRHLIESVKIEEIKP